MKEKEQQRMQDRARDLYLKYGGGSHRQIEREMKAEGWRFSRDHFYTRRHSEGLTLSWPERFGWNAMLTPEQRARIQRRANAGRHAFEIWLHMTFPEWNWSWRFQRHIYKSLMRVTTGETKRLMIFMPPRHGKTEMVTVRYTAWRLLRDQRLNVILGSYNQRLADKFSRRIKRIAGNAGAHACKDAKASDHAAGNGVCTRVACVPANKRLNTASEWETPGGGVVRSVGIGGGIAGFGAGLIVIDDPVRNRADAESETFRARVWEWFNDDIYTRLEPDAAIILIQTRWHEDDLAGRLIKEMDHGGEKWEVVSLPALAEAGNAGAHACKDATASDNPAGDPIRGSGHAVGNGVYTRVACVPADVLNRKPGRALCPERFDEKALARIKKKLGSYSFSALYQQQPAPAEGGRFKREWFRKIIDEAPPNLRWKRGYDLAVSTRTSADFTASFRCARDKVGNLYIAEGMRARMEYPDQRRYAIERMRTERNTEHGIESALHGAAFVQDIRRDMRFGHIALRGVKVDSDKLTRALAWLNLAEEGKVFLVRGPWIDEFIDEVARFPAGRYDDQIDAVSIAVNMLAQPGVTTHGF